MADGGVGIGLHMAVQRMVAIGRNAHQLQVLFGGQMKEKILGQQALLLDDGQVLRPGMTAFDLVPLLGREFILVDRLEANFSFDGGPSLAVADSELEALTPGCFT